MRNLPLLLLFALAGALAPPARADYQNIKGVEMAEILSSQTVTAGTDLPSDSFFVHKNESGLYEIQWSDLAGETLSVTPQGTIDGTNWVDFDDFTAHTFTDGRSQITVTKLKVLPFLGGTGKMRLVVGIDTGSATVRLRKSVQ